MATVPLSGTDIRLLSGIPFNNDYKNVRWFSSVSQQTTWFTSQNVRYTDNQANFQRIEGKHFMAVNKSIDDLWGTNYLMFKNSKYGNKWFYAFVTQLEYKQRNNTHVHFEIDVLQTWRFQMNFRPSYVVREHRKQYNDDGTPKIHTVDEGLDYGTDYDTVYQRGFTVNGDWKWVVIVSKAPIEEGSGTKSESSIVGYPQPLIYYFVPFHFGNQQAVIDIDGDSYPVSSLVGLYEKLFESDDAVNNIVSLYVTDHTGLKYTMAGGGDSPTYFKFLNGSRQNVSRVNLGEHDDFGNIIAVRVYRAYEFNSKNIRVHEDKYKHFDKPENSKLLMYPYAITILDDLRGNRAVIKNEYIEGNSIDVTVKGSLGLSNKNAYVIENYNNTYGIEQEQVADEYGVVSNDPNDIPIMNDYLSAFLQGNRNSLENQKNSILWNGYTNMVGSTIGSVASATQRNPMGVASGVTETVKGAGNAALQIQGLQAKLQDIGNTPPQLQKMGSNNSYDFGNRMDGIYVIKKQIKPEYRKILEDYFNMYGYKVNEVRIPNQHTRKHWNYIQTVNCNITGSFNNEDLEELKAIFDNGVTLWHTDNIGRYDLDNEVI